MYARDITYTDYNGVERTEKFYFNLNKAELLNMELEYQEKGGIKNAMNKMMDDKDAKGVVKLITWMIRHAYGEKSADGKQFLKNDAIMDGFVSTEAYSNLIMDLLNDSDKLGDFMAKIMPADIREEAEKMLKENGKVDNESVQMTIL